jgi:ABC-type phosphate transport system substrate-binding protein
MHLSRFVLPAVVCATLLVAGTARAEDFQLVVNESNPITTISRAQLARIFGDNQGEWSFAEKPVPFDLPATSGVREAFSQNVLKQAAKAVANRWMQRLFAGKAVPPAEKANDAAVLEAIGKTPGGVGYVAKGARLEKVKVVSITD